MYNFITKIRDLQHKKNNNKITRYTNPHITQKLLTLYCD